MEAGESVTIPDVGRFNKREKEGRKEKKEMAGERMNENSLLCVRACVSLTLKRVDGERERERMNEELDHLS